jgi:hypothetical protein
MGVRLVSHMPCRNDCDESNRLATALHDLGIRVGLKEQMIAAKEILQWPVTASRLFGINEMIFPALKLVTRTDWTAETQHFSYDGTYHKPEAWLWTDNGFSDPGAMRRAHTTLLTTVTDALPPAARLLDLGCGNGLLARRLTIHRPDVKVAGVDCNPTATAHAPALLGHWWTSRIQDTDVWRSWSPNAVFINPQRLLEMDTPDADRTRAQLTQVPYVFLYGYPDTTADGLEALAARAQLSGVKMLQNTPDVSVGCISVPKYS